MRESKPSEFSSDTITRQNVLRFETRAAVRRRRLLWITAVSMYLLLASAKPATADNPCFSMGFYIDVANGEVHSAQAFANEGDDDMLTITGKAFAHDLDVAETYAAQCGNDSDLLTYDVKRGNVALDAEATGILNHEIAIEAAYAALGDAICRHGLADAPVADLRIRVAAEFYSRKREFNTPNSCR